MYCKRCERELKNKKEILCPFCKNALEGFVEDLEEAQSNFIGDLENLSILNFLDIDKFNELIEETEERIRNYES